MGESSTPGSEQRPSRISDGGDSAGARTGPALNRFAVLSYSFLFVSLVDVESDSSSVLSGVFAPLAEGMYPGTAMIGILLVGAVGVLGIYFRKTWGLVVTLGVFGFYSVLMFYAAEWTIAGVAVLCGLYLLSRTDLIVGEADGA